MKAQALVITGYGINCEEETAKAFDLTGSESKILHINDLIDNPSQLQDYQILALPGGFSYGDDTGSGNAIANKMKNNIEEQILNFVRWDKLLIGICNGFQMITNLGLVPAINENYGKRQVAMMHNSNNRYECRWIHVKINSRKCVWTKDIEILHLPIAHGEGNLYCEEETLHALIQNDQIALEYVKSDGSAAVGEFPHNPNGSLKDIAGICDPSGRIFGLMPHPERFNSFTNEEGWDIKKEELIRAGKPLPQKGAGLKIFENAANYFK